MPNSIKYYRELIEQPWGRMFYEMICRQLSIPENAKLNILDYCAGFCVTANHYAKNYIKNILMFQIELYFLKPFFFLFIQP